MAYPAHEVAKSADCVISPCRPRAAQPPLLVLSHWKLFTMNQERISAPRGKPAVGNYPTTKTDTEPAAWRLPVSFPGWKSILDLEPLDAHVRHRYGQSIIRYLGQCKAARKRASVSDAKAYLEAGRASGKLTQTRRSCTAYSAALREAGWSLASE